MGKKMKAALENFAMPLAMMLMAAFGASVGGIGTPIGTGPNLIAIGAVEDRLRITFLQWMLFGVPTPASSVRSLRWKSAHGKGPSVGYGTAARRPPHTEYCQEAVGSVASIG